MGCRIIIGHIDHYQRNPKYEVAILYCSTTDTAFGPVIKPVTGLMDAKTIGEGFITYCFNVAGADPRTIPEDRLEEYLVTYMASIGEVEE